MALWMSVVDFVELYTGSKRKPLEPLPFQSLNPVVKVEKQYNSAFAFTSFGAKKTNVVEGRSGVNMLQVHGKLYRLQGPVHKKLDHASYAQFNNSTLDSELIDELSTLLHNDCDSYFVSMYKHAHELLAEENRRQELQNIIQPFHVRLSSALTMIFIVGSDRRTQICPQWMRLLE
ncbi:hypothetical protein BDB01DRAFT_898048 [Pilobolus umbonatus]|nr:hypothetical protein BDB01DRAFT_898048 [Pilobolus umbonatus]